MRYADWLRPTMVAPCVTVTMLATASVALGAVDPRFGSALTNWLVAMAAGGILALALVGTLLGVDWILARTGVCKPPTGRRAWGMGFASPVLTLACYQVYPPSQYDIGGRFVVTALLPVLLVALTTRLAFGERPEKH